MLHAVSHSVTACWLLPETGCEAGLLARHGMSKTCTEQLRRALAVAIHVTWIILSGGA
jgi:hypothetical protein